MPAAITLLLLALIVGTVLHFSTSRSDELAVARQNRLVSIAIRQSMTAIANDYGFDRVFARQIEALGRPGDVAVGISTSGSSANVLSGLQCAKARGLKTVAFTGRSGGPIGAAADVHVNVPHELTPRVQEVHRTLIHAVCDLVEQELAKDAKP